MKIAVLVEGFDGDDTRAWIHDGCTVWEVLYLPFNRNFVGKTFVVEDVHPIRLRMKDEVWADIAWW